MLGFWDMHVVIIFVPRVISLWTIVYLQLLLQIAYFLNFQEQYLECTLSKCPNKDCPEQLGEIIDRIVNKLVNSIRQHVHSYYQVRLMSSIV